MSEGISTRFSGIVVDVEAEPDAEAAVKAEADASKGISLGGDVLGAFVISVTAPSLEGTTDAGCWMSIVTEVWGELCLRNAARAAASRGVEGRSVAGAESASDGVGKFDDSACGPSTGGIRVGPCDWSALRPGAAACDKGLATGWGCWWVCG